MNIVGHFLNLVGNHLLTNIAREQGKNIFYPQTEVVQINQLTTGLFEVISNSGRQVKIFRAKHIVLGGGGKQRIPPSIGDLGISVSERRFFNSDDVLKKDGFLQFR